ncbi:MAG: VCBS repeat-containing protein [Chloroflexi bacterium]|nr:VCBS repeat-containing protein [Chloroflexota bacterium]
MMAGAVACIAGLLLSGALSASAQPPHLTAHVQPTTTEVPDFARPPTSTAISGTLHFVEVYTYSMAPYGSDSHVVADFDRDGRTDIVIAETLRPTLTGQLVLLRNLGNWQFAATTLITYPTAGSYLYTVQAADLNHDLWPDLVLRNHCEIHVLLNDQLSGFTTSWILSDGFKYYGLGLALADMNGDDAIDILAGQQSGGGGRIDLFTNAGNGTAFTLTWQSPLYGEPNAGVMANLVSAKLNNDAAPDIVASEIYNLTFRPFWNAVFELTRT